MKLHSFISEIIVFILIFLFCIVPPFFTPIIDNSSVLFQWTFPWQQLSFFIFSVVLLILTKAFKQIKLIDLLPFCLCLGFLFFTSLVFKTISIFMNKNTAIQSNIVLPENFLQWLYCIMGFFFSAVYEETIYRYFFPETLLHIVNHKWNNKVVLIFVELLGIIVFAFAHFYLGWLSVLNAAIAHIILRLCFKKTQNIYAGVLAHFIYNIISLILL